MRAAVSALVAVLFLPTPQGTGRELRVISPGVTYNAGLLDLADAFTRETGTKVTVTSAGMGRIVNDIKTATPAADVIMLPFELMSTLSLDGGIQPGTFTPLGRAEMGLAVRAGAPHPDISTVEKLAAVLKGAKAVMRSNPAGGSMVARVIEQNVIKRPEFAGVNSPVSTRGEGGQALVRGEGDMAEHAHRLVRSGRLTDRPSSIVAASAVGSTCARGGRGRSSRAGRWSVSTVTNS